MNGRITLFNGRRNNLLQFSNLQTSKSIKINFNIYTREKIFKVEQEITVNILIN